MSALNQRSTIRIKDVRYIYHCGNKSFVRMGKEPRDTAAADS
ncbi:hypothetical protein [Maritalea porphyrae]|nr:hypothetical protein [Maritalea porphyrae]MCZ4273696.1 hypothetical protein [Maritalea porphyrae]